MVSLVRQLRQNKTPRQPYIVRSNLTIPTNYPLRKDGMAFYANQKTLKSSRRLKFAIIGIVSSVEMQSTEIVISLFCVDHG